MHVRMSVRALILHLKQQLKIQWRDNLPDKPLANTISSDT